MDVIIKRMRDVTERMQNAKNTQRPSHVRKQDILSAVKDINASYKKAFDTALRNTMVEDEDVERFVYPDIRDVMEELLEIAEDRPLAKGDAPTSSPLLRVTAIKALEECLDTVANTKTLHEKLPQIERSSPKEDIVKKHFAALMNPQTEEGVAIEWPRKIACGEDLLGKLKEISVHPFNTEDVQDAAKNVIGKCETHLRKLNINFYSAESRWIPSKDRGIKNNQVS